MQLPTIDEFLDKVRLMRHMQREYFRTRGWATLHEAKKAEQEVDDMLDCLTGPDLVNFRNTQLKIEL
jgi:hypothetical protein